MALRVALGGLRPPCAAAFGGPRLARSAASVARLMAVRMQYATPLRANSVTASVMPSGVTPASTASVQMGSRDRMAVGGMPAVIAALRRSTALCPVSSGGSSGWSEMPESRAPSSAALRARCVCGLLGNGDGNGDGALLVAPFFLLPALLGALLPASSQTRIAAYSGTWRSATASP